MINIKSFIIKLVKIADLTEEKLSIELEKGYMDFVKGNIKPAEKTFSDINKDYEIEDM